MEAKLKKSYYDRLNKKLRLQRDCAKAMVKYQTRIIKH